MTLAIVCILIGVLLLLLTASAVLHVVGIVLALLGVVGLVMVLFAGRPRV